MAILFDLLLDAAGIPNKTRRDNDAAEALLEEMTDSDDKVLKGASGVASMMANAKDAQIRNLLPGTLEKGSVPPTEVQRKLAIALSAAAEIRRHVEAPGKAGAPIDPVTAHVRQRAITDVYRGNDLLTGETLGKMLATRTQEMETNISRYLERSPRRDRELEMEAQQHLPGAIEIRAKQGLQETAEATLQIIRTNLSRNLEEARAGRADPGLVVSSAESGFRKDALKLMAREPAVTTDRQIDAKTIPGEIGKDPGRPQMTAARSAMHAAGREGRGG